MSATAETLILAHWRLANARDWPAFMQLLDPGMIYEIPQTREFIRGSAGYVDFFATWQQPWQATVVKCIADESSAFTQIEFTGSEEPLTGLTVFEVRAGRITRVTDHWPSPYEPPKRASIHVERW